MAQRMCALSLSVAAALHFAPMTSVCAAIALLAVMLPPAHHLEATPQQQLAYWLIASVVGMLLCAVLLPPASVVLEKSSSSTRWLHALLALDFFAAYVADGGLSAALVVALGGNNVFPSWWRFALAAPALLGVCAREFALEAMQMATLHRLRAAAHTRFASAEETAAAEAAWHHREKRPDGEERTYWALLRLLQSHMPPDKMPVLVREASLWQSYLAAVGVTLGACAAYDPDGLGLALLVCHALARWLAPVFTTVVVVPP